jgi:CDP-paratose 2-epimerase
LTGPNHSGVELHGFLSFLVKCNIEQRTYRVFGYKGKQVRDNIHSVDVARFIDCFIAAPRSAEVYNIGGGRANSISIVEAFKAISAISGNPMKYEYVDTARNGDHICYISDLKKMKSHYPQWSITKDLSATLTEIHDAYIRRTFALARRRADATA